MKPKECAGCAKWGNTLNSCYFTKHPHKYIRSCPCGECLIKTICEGSEKRKCNEFEKSLVDHWGRNQVFICVPKQKRKENKL
jgi:hypothetical protein